MTTVLQVLVVWVLLSAAVAAGVCLLISGSRMSTHRRRAREASLPAGRPLDEDGALSA